MAEILAPLPDLAMSHDILKAGADRLYTGLRQFSREAVPSSPDINELITFAKVYPREIKRIHVALNIIPSPGEREIILDTVGELLSRGYGNFIINDHGLLSMISRKFPGASLCGSVGLSTVNPLDASFLQHIGADAMVLPIFSSPGDLREIKRISTIRVEVFAICRGEPVVQGKCMLAGYLVRKGKGNEETALLSSKKTGLCYTVCRSILGAYPDHDITQSIGEWIEAGADIFKIEGRYRKREEIIGMVRKVREALNKFKNP